MVHDPDTSRDSDTYPARIETSRNNLPSAHALDTRYETANRYVASNSMGLKVPPYRYDAFPSYHLLRQSVACTSDSQLSIRRGGGTSSMEYGRTRITDREITGIHFLRVNTFRGIHLTQNRAVHRSGQHRMAERERLSIGVAITPKSLSHPNARYCIAGMPRWCMHCGCRSSVLSCRFPFKPTSFVHKFLPVTDTSCRSDCISILTSSNPDRSVCCWFPHR